MITIEFLDVVTDAVDQRFRGARLFKRNTTGWDLERIRDGVHLDLSRARSASYQALAQLLLLIEGMADMGAAVTVTLPALHPTPRELNALDARPEAAAAITRTLRESLHPRLEARRFMQRTGFIDAVAVRHIASGSVSIVDQDRGLKREPRLPDSIRRTALAVAGEWEAAEQPDDLFVPDAFRFRWILRNEPNLRGWAKDLEAVVVQAGRGLDVPDAEIISRLVLGELLNNVWEHAFINRPGREPSALVGAAFLTTRSARTALHFPQLFEEYASSIEARGNGSHLFRLVIGDSGVGIPSTLAGSFNDRFIAYLPDVAAESNTDNRLCLWAFSPLSTRVAGRGSDGSVRGLSRVWQQVRHYAGTVRVRSLGADAGWAFIVPSDAKAHIRNRAAYVPGTLLDVSLRTASASRLVESAHTSSDETQLICVRVRSIDQLGESLARQLASGRGDAGVVAIVEQDSLPGAGGVGAARAVSHAASVAQPFGPLTIIFSSVLSNDLYGGFLPLDTSTYRDSVGGTGPDADYVEVPKSPVLLLGCDLAAVWWGGQPTERLYLEALGFLAGLPSVATEFETEEQAMASAQRMRAPDVRYFDWATAHGPPSLRVNRHNVDRAVCDLLGREIRDRVTGADGGVRSGPFLTSNLHRAERYLDVDRLLTRDVGSPGIVALAAASHIRALVEEASQLRVVVLPDVPQAIVDSVAKALRLRERPLRLDPALDGWRSRPPAGLARGASTVIVAGARMSGETLRQAAEALVRWEVAPRAVIAVVDASGGREAYIEALYHDIPLRRLAAIDVGLGDVHDDEHLKEPSTASADLSYDIEEEQLTDLVAGCGVGFYLNHIERSADRHFITYVNVPELLQDERARPLLFDRLSAAVREWLSAQGGGVTRVWYPADDTAGAGSLASSVSASIGDDAEVVPIPRPSQPETAVVLAPDAGAYDAHVVFVDWGVVTAGTVRDVGRMAVHSGARSFKCAILTSQLEIFAEAHLREIAAMKSGSGSPPVGTLPFEAGSPNAVPVDFEFLARSPVVAYRGDSCPLCRVSRHLVDMGKDAPTLFLRQHATDKMRVLRPRDREQVLREGVDLYGVPLRPGEAVESFRIRQLVKLSRSRNHPRLALLNELTDVATSRDTRRAVAWVRLLSCEHELLHVPPLSHAKFRDAVAQVAAMLLRPQGGQLLEAGLRRQAIVALRAASKQAFLEAMPALLEDCIPTRIVVGELLFAAYTILRRPYYHGATVMHQLHAQLLACQEITREAVAAGDIDRDILDTVERLAREATTLVRRGGADMTAVEAWHKLRVEYLPQLDVHNRALGQVNLVRNWLSGPYGRAAADGKVARETVVDEIAKSWSRCAEFLSSTVLPYLPRVRPMLEGGFYRETTSEEDWERWMELLDGGGREQDVRFSRLLQRVVGERRFTEADRTALEVELQWVQRFLLSSPRDSSPATLAGWLQDCPTDLRDIPALALDELGVLRPKLPDVASKISVDAGDNLVFIPGRLARDVFAQVATNLVKHRNEAHAEPVRVTIDARSVDDGVELVIANSGTVPRPARSTGRDGLSIVGTGGGLEGLENRCREFDARLSYGLSDITGWFETRVLLRRWEVPRGT